ncbi:MAG: carboxymuconolactone decarboxylase family protein [Phycisphaeraceae bacterium]|nr:carboxymuconolactone decarboxylase family protein [Phycisphaeraceae bacterium]
MPPTPEPRESPSASASRPPKTFQQFVARYPSLGEAHQHIAREVESLGPLDARLCALVKIGISLGAGLESALRSHVRRAVEAGATRHEIEQAILLGMNTVGFPRTVAAWSWANQQFERDDPAAPRQDARS